MHENARARFDLTGRIALVTGASRGIGREIATALAEHGAFVWLGGRDMERLDAVSASLKSQGLSAAPLAFDVTNAGSTTEAVALAIAERGPVDILVNNAGIQHRRPLAEWTDEDWRRVIDNNLTACFRLACLLAPGMIERGWGRIVSTGSVTGLRGRATIHAYVAAKAGLHGLTMSLAAELGQSGVTANAIAPGYTATEINTALLNDAAFTERVRTRTPVGRWADPKEMAGAVVFLASPAASYVNGHVLVVDGGLTTSL